MLGLDQSGAISMPLQRLDCFFTVPSELLVLCSRQKMESLAPKFIPIIGR